MKITLPPLTAFLANWERFKVYRFMDWMDTNHSDVEDPDDYPDPGSISKDCFCRCNGRPCNLQQADMWITLPHKATDALVTEFARYIRDSGPFFDLLREYSNEVWNNQFSQFSYAFNQLSNNLSNTGNNQEDGAYWTGYRSYQIHKIFEDEFNAAANASLHKVIGWQATTHTSSSKASCLVSCCRWCHCQATLGLYRSLYR